MPWQIVAVNTSICENRGRIIMAAATSAILSYLPTIITIIIARAPITDVKYTQILTR